MAKKKDNKQLDSQFKSFFEVIKKERVRFISGVISSFIGFYMLLGQISFLFTGDDDQSKVQHKSYWELITNKQEVANWTGVTGAFWAERLINEWFGIFSILISIYLFMLGLHLMRAIQLSLLKVSLLTAIALIWGSILSAFTLSNLFGGSHIVWGGAHGQYLVDTLQQALGIPGVLLAIVLVSIIFFVAVRKEAVAFFHALFEKLSGKSRTTTSKPGDLAPEDENVLLMPTLTKEEDAIITLKPEDFAPGGALAGDKGGKGDNYGDDDFEIFVPTGDDTVGTLNKEKEEKEEEKEKEDTDETNLVDLEGEELEEYDPTKDLSHFKFPSTDLLKVYQATGKAVDLAEQNENKHKIISTLQDYGIEITSIKATVGPTITLYEIIPKAGVRISKIRNLEDDIALSLSALGIRIIAPMPGKGTIGIEVPNKDPQIVSMQSVIASRKFQECTYDLPVALGRTITNEVFTFDLAKMPHLLVAGATGQGKSVGLNAIITSLLYKKHPAEMKMVLVDPKMVEFNIYSRIEKHYLAKLPNAEKAIITDVSRVTQTLTSLTVEMDARYELLMEAGVRNIKEYNEKFKKRKLSPRKGHKYLPYIVVVIDEFGDLIMTAGKEIEMPIARIAQKARAVGMHMIIATQRPTTNIITGTIKANFPARMAFRVTSQIDSRTILDMSGANQLIGRGDMLFSQGSDLVRIQCAFVDTPEVDDIAKYIEEQQGYSSAFELPEFVPEGAGDTPGAIDLNEKDALFEEAARLIVIQQQGSTSMIQRRFSIGYNRAGRLMDQLEVAGIVGAAQGSKPREVLIGDEYSLEQKLSSI